MLNDEITAGGATSSGEASGAGKSSSRYIVQPGDTLSKIAKHYYGDPNRYMDIFNANRDILTDPDKIHPGQELTIP